jgi:DNA polymerase III alpha subunit
VVNEKSEITPEYLSKCKSFLDNVYNYLDVYITIEDNRLKRTIFEQLIKMQALESLERDRYSLLWNRPLSKPANAVADSRDKVDSKTKSSSSVAVAFG